MRSDVLHEGSSPVAADKDIRDVATTEEGLQEGNTRPCSNSPEDRAKAKQKKKMKNKNQYDEDGDKATQAVAGARQMGHILTIAAILEAARDAYHTEH